MEDMDLLNLESASAQLAAYVVSSGLPISEKPPPHRHVGAVIADAVLQIGHAYEQQVRSRVIRLRQDYPEAATISGFLHLLDEVGARELLGGWKGTKEWKRVHEHSTYFAAKGIQTFDELFAWLTHECHRDELVTAELGIRDKTADYYRVLVGIPDAIKVDQRIEAFLMRASIEIDKYDYKGLRSVVQLAARQLGRRPIDLDWSIWHNGVARNSEEIQMGKDNEFIVSLPPERMSQLEAVAQQYGDSPAAIARFWIIDRLLQLHPASNVVVIREPKTNGDGERLLEEALNNRTKRARQKVAPELKYFVDAGKRLVFLRMRRAVFEQLKQSKPEFPISNCMGATKVRSSTRAMVVSRTNAVNHPVEFTRPSFGVVG